MATPSLVPHYIYWSVGIVSSIIALIGVGIFIYLNWKKKPNTSIATLDFKLASAWQGFRVLLALAQLVAHPALFLFRNDNGQNRNAIEELVYNVAIVDFASWSQSIDKCNVSVCILIMLSTIYCAGAFYSGYLKKTGIGLSTARSSIIVEAMIISLWLYVLLYRCVYSKRDLWNAYNVNSN